MLNETVCEYLINTDLFKRHKYPSLNASNTDCFWTLSLSPYHKGNKKIVFSKNVRMYIYLTDIYIYIYIYIYYIYTYNKKSFKNFKNDKSSYLSTSLKSY